jgi:hypothetical protein
LSEYQIKLEAVREYQDALRYKKTFAEGLELESGLLREIVTYYERVGLEIPERAKVFEFMDRLLVLASLEMKHPEESPDNEAEPDFLSGEVI